MTSTKVAVADYLMSRLNELGTHHIAGVVGDFSLHLFQHIEKSKVKLIPTCNELNAGYFADAYSRVTGKLGALAVTYSVGEMSAINAIGGSFSENVPVVLIGGCPATIDYQNVTPLHHVVNNDYDIPWKALSLVTIASVVLKDVTKAAENIDFCLTAAIYNKLPVYIGIPSDVVSMKIDAPKTKLVVPQRPKSCKEELKLAVHDTLLALQESKNPVILLDHEIDKFHLHKEVKELVQNSGLPFITNIMGKGIITETHKMYGGTYSGNRSQPQVQKLVEDADFLLILGLKVTDFNSGGWSEKFPKDKSIFANMDTLSMTKHTFLNINLREFIQELADKVKFVLHDEPEKPLLTLSKPTSRKISMQYLFDRVSQWIPDNSTVIAETGSALFAGAEMQLSKNSTFLAQVMYGSIGFTVGGCLGSAIAGSKMHKRAVCFVGDGSFQVTCQDLSTMIRYKCNPVIFLLNNGNYLVENLIGNGREFNDIQPWKYSELVNVFGGSTKTAWGVRVEKETELELALKKAKKNHRKLAFIEVILPKCDAPRSMIAASASMAKVNHVTKPPKICKRS